MAGPRGFRQRSHPRSQEAQINRFNTQVRQDPNFIYQTRSPAGNQYDQRDFSTVDSSMTQGIRQRQVNGGPIDLKTMGFENTYFTNPRTGQRFGSSVVEGPGGSLESRNIYPDASGYGERNGNIYPIQLKGPQTWNYDPGNSGIMLAMSNNPTVDKIKNIYNRVDPFIPDIDIDDREIGYDYEKDLGPGTFNVGGDYDFDDNQYNFNLGYKMTFDDGGMATLPTPHDNEGIATLPTPERMQRERVPLTDEQKDYLYDYMLDFMFKQKQREQMEQESIIPPFNYEGLEV